MPLNDALIDELLKDTKSPEDLLGEHGLLKQLTKRLVERMLDEELTDHLGYDKNDPAGRNSGNSRNGHSDKTIIADHGKIDLKIPRDRDSSFEPILIPKGQRRLPALRFSAEVAFLALKILGGIDERPIIRLGLFLVQ